MEREYEVVIIGGSYAGLAAAMALGRSLRKVVVIDSGNPCNKQTPASHNLITHDGTPPSQISAIAKEQVLQYPTVDYLQTSVTDVVKEEKRFIVTTENSYNLSCRKLLFATGLKDLMPQIDGFAECWGISVLHCPYCHGYEVRGEKMGLLANGDMGFDFCKLLYNWSKDLILFTNGPSSLSAEQRQKLDARGIQIVETPVNRLVHQHGYLEEIILADEIKIELKTLFARIPFEQHSNIPAGMGCEITEHGLIKTDTFQQTSVSGIYAAGDCTAFRSVAVAIASGTMTGAFINKALIEEDF